MKTMQRILSKLPRWELDHKDDDIRGWPLRDADGRMIGTISDLVADTDTKCVTQVILANGRRISAHDLWLGDHVVTLGSASRAMADEAKTRPAPAKLAAVPAAAAVPATKARAEVKPLARPQEAIPAAEPVAQAAQPVAQAAQPVAQAAQPVAQAAQPVAQAAQPVEQTEDVIIPLVDEELEITKRQVDAGGVRIQTRTVTKEIHRDIPLREEKVTVERRRVDEPLSMADAEIQLHDRAVEVKATSERPLVTKRTHAVEEIVIKKERTERTEQVQDSLRHTEAELMDLAAQNRSKT
jgi:uncharacterized protein (TIGR02271 family)